MPSPGGAAGQTGTGASGAAVPAEGKLESLLADARRCLAAVETAFAQFLDRSHALASSLEKDQAEMQRFYQYFVLGPELIGGSRPEADRDSGPLLDLDAYRRNERELAEQVARGQALRGSLEAVSHILRGCGEQLEDDRAFEPIEASQDVLIQQGMNYAREDERRRLAREIHDGPAQVLANAIFVVDIATEVARRTPEQVPEELGRVKALLKDGVAEIRRFMFDLRPQMLEEQGLAATVEYYVRDYNRLFNMKIAFSAAEPLPALAGQDDDLHVFRIVQETLQNTRKHAGTDRGSIALWSEGGHLLVKVADEGRGFRPQNKVSRPGSGYGLNGMRDRANLIGADFQVLSRPDAGTEIWLSVPTRPQAGGPDGDAVGDPPGGEGLHGGGGGRR